MTPLTPASARLTLRFRDVETTTRHAAVETQRLAVVSAWGVSRDGVLSAFDGLITTVQAARDAFRAG